MNIALDAYYSIGRLHLYCEDYVYQGWEPFPYVILADGCSASPDSDVGARLLVLSARRLLPWLARATRGSGQEAPHWPLGRKIIRRAARRAWELGLELEALDATLLVAWCDGATVFVHLYGDGCIATRGADGELAVIQVEYAGNAPYYLSYLLDAERQILYQEVVGEPLVAQTIHYLGEAGVSSRTDRFDAPTVFKFSLTTFPVVAVATDGLHSFVNVETRQRMELLEVARAMLDFSGREDAFVKKRTQNALNEFGRRRIVNLDDLSLGAFVRLG